MNVLIEPRAEQPEASDSKPGPKPDAKDDLKSLPWWKWRKNWVRVGCNPACQTSVPGKSNKETAAEPGIGIKTVEKHRGHHREQRPVDHRLTSLV
jgi:hypothetical protein